MSSLFKNFILKALYGVLGTIAAALVYTAQNFHPTGSTVENWVWNTIIVGAMTGLAATIKRLIEGAVKK